MASIYFNKEVVLKTQGWNCLEIKNLIAKEIGLFPSEIYLEQNGYRLTSNDTVSGVAHCRLRVLGGKGGFGSMLRAIGAQIEKTTNREACRDLSGRRLRDINEEKRLKAVLEKMGDVERESKERKKRKIEKLLAVPRHDFKDKEYEESREKLADKVNTAVEEGLKKSYDKPGCSDHLLKRKIITSKTTNAKKKKTALWIDDDILNSDDSEESSIESDSPTGDPHKKDSVERKTITECDVVQKTEESTNISI